MKPNEIILSVTLFILLISVPACLPGVPLKYHKSPALLRASETYRTYRLEELRDLSTEILANPPEKEATASAQEVFYKLKKLDSATSVGINYKDYTPYVREAKFALDKFSIEFRNEQKLIRFLSLCLKPYIEAQTYFSGYVKGGSFGGGAIISKSQNEYYLKDNWRTGSAAVMVAEVLFRLLQS